MDHQKVCVVTGGSLGIGRCLCLTFAQQGYAIAWIDRDEKAAQELDAMLPAATQRLFYQGDVGDQTALEGFAEAVKNRFGSVDCLIHNACESKKGILSGCGYDDFLSVLRVGVAAPYYLTLLFKDALNKGACVVNISSTRAFQSQQDTESYSAAKGGITALTHALAVSLSGAARVNAIAPGWIDTGAHHDPFYQPAYMPGDEAQHPGGRVGTPEDIAAAALYLCGESGGFVNGQTIVVDGGMSKLMIYHGDHGWGYKPADS